MRSIRTFILATALLISLALFGGAYLVVSSLYERSVRNDARETAQLLARQTFNAMFQVMRMGWSRSQLEGFLTATRDSYADSTIAIEIYRGPKVEALFGPIEQPPFDTEIEHAFAGDGSSSILDTPTALRQLYPLVAGSECLRCHVNAATGDVLGVIDVRQDLGPLLDAARNQFAGAFVLIVPVALGIALLVALLVSRRLQRALTWLQGNIQEINSLDDLTLLSTSQLDLGFTEFDQIAHELEHLTGRMRDIAVDRDLLEFEIRLLEKFVITSEVVRDWRDYVSNLLVEINSVVTSYALFSIFKLEEEAYDLEVFWRGTPSRDTRLLLEKVVRQAMVDHQMFTGPAEVAINHNIANAAEMLPELDEEGLLFRTKTLLVERPKIGGIVGIGVHSETAIDPTRMLVVESILSTLLNVVGSVKAIYKYTRDLEYYATRDPLTNLYNQRVFWELLGYEIGRAERGSYNFALLVIDFDNFKAINDTYGHGFGDECLQQFSQAIRGALRRPDILCRYGGDEFVAILPEASDEQPFTVGERVRVAIHDLRIFAPNGQPVQATVSIGCSVYPDHAKEAKDLFLFADNMMYKAKSEGKDRLSVPSQDDVVDVFRRIGEKGMLINNAIQERRVVPYFQPICDTGDGHVVAYEVLGRIDLGEGAEVITAEEFIATAEQMGVVHRLDFITIEKAFAIVSETDYEGLLFLNLSPKNLVLRDFLSEIRRLVAEYRITPGRVVFEITERDTVRNMALLKNFLNELKADGYKFAIDDFGSGFSSFHYLKHFPIDFIKIEGDFVASMVRDPRDHAFVKSISTLAEELGIISVAEYIEDAEIYRAVQKCGVNLAQGYHVGRPARTLLPPAELPPGATR